QPFAVARDQVVVPVRGLVVVAILPRQERSSRTPDVRAGRVRRACDDAPLSFPVRLCDAPYLLQMSPGGEGYALFNSIARSIRHFPSAAPLRSSGRGLRVAPSFAVS